MEYGKNDEFDEQFKTVNVGEFFDFVAAPLRSKKSNRCPICGYTAKRFLETGFLGCTECYKHLYDVIEPAILRLFGKKEHICKDYDVATKEIANRQNYSQRASNTEDDVSTLQLELDLAVKNEDYERAAYLKHKINRIKGN